MWQLIQEWAWKTNSTWSGTWTTAVATVAIAIAAWGQWRTSKQMGQVLKNQEEANVAWRWEHSRLRALEPYMGGWKKAGEARTEATVVIEDMEISSAGVAIQWRDEEGRRKIGLGMDAYQEDDGTLIVTAERLTVEVRRRGRPTGMGIPAHIETIARVEGKITGRDTLAKTWKFGGKRVQGRTIEERQG